LTGTVATERRLSFGSVAEDYDRARPSYPAALVDDVLALVPATPPARVLEAGAGTGKATVLLAARGAAVIAVEPDPGMAAVARRNCAPWPAVRVDEAEFERWDPEGDGFSLVVCAQAWHWLDPGARYVRARAALADGGALAVFWNRPEWERCPLRAELDAAYREVRFAGSPGPMHPAATAAADLSTDWAHEIAEAGGFADPEVRAYRWSAAYSTAQYLDLISTHSDHIVLDEARRAALLGAVAAVLDRHGGGLELPYVTTLFTARAV
jgi:SAM-dependent methyltransferase